MKKDAERRRCDTKNIRRETKLFINRFVSVCHLERVRVPLGGMRTSRKIPKVRPLPCRLEVFSPNCMCCLFPSAIHRAGWCEITPCPAPPECHPRGLPQFLLRQNRRIGRTAPHRRVSRSWDGGIRRLPSTCPAQRQPLCLHGCRLCCIAPCCSG